ncbi:S8 family peptidase [bacterium]|nr:MAG: S8 family peptidase [bacterium]
MKLTKTTKLGLLGLAASTLFAACDNPVNISKEAQADTKIENQYIVRLNEGTFKSVPGADRMETVRLMTATVLDENEVSTENVFNYYGHTISGFAAKLSPSEMQKLSKDNRIKSIEVDHVIALAPPSGKGGGGSGGSTSQKTPWGITRVGGAVSGVGKTIFIIDSGVDLDHPDLNVDVARSRTFITSGKDSRDADDGNGHGTHCAGTVAALNNSIGVIGVAPGATVVAVKVLDSRGSGAYSSVIAGVDYVASVGKAGDVANMSLGGPVSQALDDAVVAAAQKGILFALAAGNESQDANNSSPARANHQNIFTVSAMNSSDVFASFSNYGNPPVDFCAPGVSIESTWKGAGYNTISGTSMASPHVAGLLLVTNGRPTTSGYVNGDPDGNPDPIAHN